MKVLLLSAYDAESHQYWRKGLVKHFPNIDWTVLTLPARFYSWRVRGNSLSWAYNERETLQKNYDLVLATSMTDLSALKGLAPSLANIPTILYFHENQFEYPSSGEEFNSVEPQLLSIYSALSANAVVFNSEYNRRTFLQGCQQLLNKLPDHVPKGLAEKILEKSHIIPVPIIDDCIISPGLAQNIGEKHLEITWNHRWEYDKGPTLLFDVVSQLIKQKANFKINVVGQHFREIPEVFEQLHQLLLSHPKHMGIWGYIERNEDYQNLLKDSDIVLSTALHDFQGLAIIHGVAAGCLPVVPDRLAYPEFFDASHRYQSNGDEVTSITQRLSDLAKLKSLNNLPHTPSVNHLTWSTLRKRYSWLLNDLLFDV